MPGVSLSGGGFKIRAHPRESRAPQATSSRKSAEDSPFTSSGAQMWRCGWGGGQRIALALGVPPFSSWSGGYIYAGGIRAIARLYVNSLTGGTRRRWVYTRFQLCPCQACVSVNSYFTMGHGNWNSERVRHPGHRQMEGHTLLLVGEWPDGVGLGSGRLTGP